MGYDTINLNYLGLLFNQKFFKPRNLNFKKQK